jgi:hypothetical protein
VRSPLFTSTTDNVLALLKTTTRTSSSPPRIGKYNALAATPIDIHNREYRSQQMERIEAVEDPAPGSLESTREAVTEHREVREVRAMRTNHKLQD